MTGLPPRQLELLARVSGGETYRQIARDWGVQEITVRGYGHRAMAALGANHIAHAVLLACRAGLIDGTPQRHGDHAGFEAHRRRGEPPCDPCRAGERAYRNGRRHKPPDGATRDREPPRGSQSAPIR